MLLSMAMTTATMKMMTRLCGWWRLWCLWEWWEWTNPEPWKVQLSWCNKIMFPFQWWSSIDYMLSWDNTVQYQQHWYRVSSTIASLPRHRVTLHRPAGQPEAFDLGLVPLGSHGSPAADHEKIGLPGGNVIVGEGTLRRITNISHLWKKKTHLPKRQIEGRHDVVSRRVSQEAMRFWNLAKTEGVCSSSAMIAWLGTLRSPDICASAVWSLVGWPIPQYPCMVYLPTYTMEMNQM